ncbi:MAG: hypothetical protein BGO29_07470 [Bacteroidales bacterium 36-12]|nr:MAG: hypothetical protein BGO29_07470 [Bacteroidales bacterium 36-12]
MAKTFVLHDESLNTQGFWMVTGGADLEQFKKNPIMLWNHNRSWADREDTLLPIGHWDNIRVEKDRILADAVFDSDDFSQKIAQKVEAGTLRMASAGAIPVETSTDTGYIKQGQRYETVTKWRMREASIVDIGANNNSLALYDTEGNLIELSDASKNPLKELTIQNNNHMKEVFNHLKLADNATAQDVLGAIKPIEKENIQLKADLKKEQDEKKLLQDRIDAIELKEKQEKRASFDKELADAFKDGRLSEKEDGSVKKEMISLYESSPDATLTMIRALTPRKSVSVALGDSKGESAWEKRQKEIEENAKK